MAGVLCVFVFFNYIYEDVDSLLIVNDSLVICDLHQYNMKIHLNNAVLKVRLWNGTDSTGKVILRAPQIHIHSSSMIQGNGYGYLGGTNTHPNGYGPGYGQAGISGGGGGGRLTLKETGNDTLSIYDVAGRVVKKISKTGHSNYIDLSMMQDGVYFIKTSNSCALNKVILIR